MSQPSGARLGLRKEVLILLPVALLLLLVLAGFTLLNYRVILQALLVERQAEARQLAAGVAYSLEVVPHPSSQDLQRLAPTAYRAALVDAEGSPIAQSGGFQEGNLLLPLGNQLVTQPIAIGPDPRVPNAVAGFALLSSTHRVSDAVRIVRVDLPALTLAAGQRTLKFLTILVVSLGSATSLLVLFFLRYLMQPYETMLARARSVSGATNGDSSSSNDEVNFLLSTFDQALTALARSNHDDSSEDDIAVLQRTLTSSLESGLLLLDRQGRILALNAIGAQLLDSAETQEGRAAAEAFDHQPRFLEVLDQAVATGGGSQRQEAHVQVDGESRTLGLTVHPLRRNDGAVRGFLVLFADLTQAQRQAEEERLASGLEQLGEMAAGVAHELRNSLATLQGYLTLIDKSPDQESIRDYVTEIRHEGNHLQRVVDDFLAFARPESARLEDVDLARVVRRAVQDPALEEARVELVQGDDSGPLHIKGDAQLLERAVRNLLSNACQAHGETGEAGAAGAVEVQVRLEGGSLVVEIADRGPGLPPEVRRRLFQPFVSGRAGGVGLGLSLARRIVDLHGGTLRLEPREGGGTLAEIRFPADTSVS